MILNEELARLRARNDASGLVDRAKLMLQESGMSEEEAFATLRSSAMDQRLTIAEAAAQVVG